MRALFAALFVILVMPLAANAHPHVWVTVKSEILFDDNKRVTGVRHEWTFDPAYSAYVVQGLDQNSDGEIDENALKNVASVNADALKEFGFFTKVLVKGREVTFQKAEDYKMKYSGERLTLGLLLRFDQPMDAHDGFVIEIYDPTFFVSLTLSGADDAIKLVDAPPNCSLSVTRPESVRSAQQQLSEAFFATLDGSSDFGAKFANKAVLNCP